MATFASKRTPDQGDRIALALSTAADGLSDVADLGGLRLAAVEMSTAWTAADLAFLGSGRSSAALKAVYRAADSTAPALYQVGTTANRVIAFNSDAFRGVRFLQLASVTAGSTSAVAQGAARTMTLLLAPVGTIK